jgi:SAM-dependent methyltransferase
MKIVHLGCGRKKHEGAIGVDMHFDTQADVVHDLNNFPYPFSDSEFDMVICDNVLEHLDDVIKAMGEINRIAKVNAKIEVIVPHFSSDDSFTDITHKHFFSRRSFDYFDSDKTPFDFYSKAKFKVNKAKINFGRLGRLCGLQCLANIWPSLYERHLAFICRAHSIDFELEVIK